MTLLPKRFSSILSFELFCEDVLRVRDCIASIDYFWFAKIDLALLFGQVIALGFIINLVISRVNVFIGQDVVCLHFYAALLG
jgi:hypothetical protein